MSSLIPRRQFLKRGVLSAGGVAAACAGGVLPTARAIEPIARTGKSLFKFSMAAYSYRDLLNAKPPKTRLTLDDFILDCAKLGLEGTELTSYYFPNEITPEYLRHVKQLCFRLGLDVSGTAVGNDFCHPAGAERDREAAWRGYQLVNRNCVTELFAVIDAGAGDERLALGETVARAPWNAIPFVAAAAVADSPRVVGRETWPSYRQAARRRRLEREPGLAAWLAETTAATAAGYRPGPDDSTFLFFTDETVAARPLLGAANLAAASAGGVLGLFTWPADGGRRLEAGARGALYSLPELGFVNIRKGTTAWLLPEELPAP